MSNSYIQVPPDEGGKKVETNSVDGITQRQVITPGSSTGTVTQAYTNNGESLVIVDNFPSVQVVSVSGNISVNVPNPLGVSGSISVNNFPSIQNVDVINTVAISGAVSLVGGNVTVPNPLGVSGTITALQGTSPWITQGTIINTVGVSGNVSISQPVSVNVLNTLTVSGIESVDVLNVVAVSGTVTSLQGTNPWIVQVNNFPSTINPIGVSGSVSISNFPATQNVDVVNVVAVSGNLNATVNVPNPLGVSGTINVGNFPTVQNVQVINTAAVSGSISVLNTISGNINLTELSGIALGQPSTYGLSPGAVKVPSVNAFITNTVPVSGALSVTFPNNQNVSVINTAAVSGTVTVDQGASNNSPLAGWTVAIVDNQSNGPVTVFDNNGSSDLAVAICGIDGNQIGSTEVTVNTGLNTYIINATLDVAITNASIAVTQQGTLDVSTIGNLRNITTKDSGSVVSTIANSGTFITGSPTINSYALFSFSNFGYDTVVYLVTGAWTGTLVVEASLDDNTWVTAGIHQQGTSYSASTFSNNFIGEHNVAGYQYTRIRANSATWAGTASVQAIFTVNPRVFYLANPIKIQDSTLQGVTTTVKPASAPALVTDNALVVAISPNNIIPVNVVSGGGSTIVPNPLGISGTINIGNTVSVSGNVSVTNLQSVNVLNTAAVSGTVTVVQPTGANLHVDIDNFPSTINPLGISGSISVLNFPSTQNVQVINTVAVSGTVSINQPINANVLNTVNVSGTISGNVTAFQGTTPWQVVSPVSSGSTLSVLSVSGGSGSILVANNLRKEVIVTNNGTSVVYLGLAIGPSLTVYNIPLSACKTANDGTGGSYVSDIWKGQIYAIANGTSTVSVTELT